MSLIPPVAKKVPPTERTHHGHTFVDDYEWLRDKDNAEVVAYLEAENAYTDEQTAALEPCARRSSRRSSRGRRKPTCRCHAHG